jgi:hypothetical protein
MGCFVEDSAKFIHFVLLGDVALYVIYLISFKTASKPLTVISKIGIQFNVLAVLLLCFIRITGLSFHFGFQLLGVGFASVIGFIILNAAGTLLFAGLMHALLILSAQFTNTFIPPMLVDVFGLSSAWASSIALLFPLIALAVLEFSLNNAFTAVIINSIFVSWLVVLMIAVYSQHISFTDDVCCDIGGDCVLIFDKIQLGVLVVLSALLIGVYIVRHAIDLKVWIAESCCCCCKKKQQQREQDGEVRGEQLVPLLQPGEDQSHRHHRQGRIRAIRYISIQQPINMPR